MNASHLPVMLDEVLACLAVRPDGRYVDATFGCGGYSRTILDAGCLTLHAFDRDPAAAAIARDFAPDGRFRFHHLPFSQMQDVLEPGTVDGIVFDLGVSSPQLDQPERGFSFRLDGPLDMRMAQDGPTAADLVNTLPEAEIAGILWKFGEERLSRRIARRIVAQRAVQPYQTTRELAETVRRCVPPSRDGIDPATRTFQALRIAVNDELGELDRGLGAAERLLAPGGVLVVVSFHSLEDRAVKHFLRARSQPEPASRHLPAPPARELPFDPATVRAMRPTDTEVTKNPRARSAHLRVAQKSRISLGK